MGHGQEGLVPGQKLKKVQAGVRVQSLRVSLGCSTAGGLGLGKREEGPGGCGRFVSVFGSRISASSARLGPGQLEGRASGPWGHPSPKADSGVPLLFS